MVAAVKPTPGSSRARRAGRPLDIPEADWAEAVRREAAVRALATAGVNSRLVIHAAAADLGLSRPSADFPRAMPAEPWPASPRSIG
jgi:hypothetical protein